MFGDAFEVAEDPLAVGAYVCPILWFASRDAFLSGELIGDFELLFTFAEVSVPSADPVPDGHDPFEGLTLDEPKELDITELSTGEFEQLTAKVLQLEAEDERDEGGSPGVVGLASEFAGVAEAERRILLEHDAEEDMLDARAEAALLAGIGVDPEDISTY